MTANHSSQPRKINAKQAAKDIESGLSDRALMDKYGLSERGLRSLVEKLGAAGLLQGSPRDSMKPSEGSIPLSAWKCPACGKPRPEPVEECPGCGVIVAKYLSIYGPGEPHLDQSSESPPMMTGIDHTGMIAGVASSPAMDVLQRPDLEATIQEDTDEITDQVFPEPRTLDRQGKIILVTTPLAALLCFAIWWFQWTLNTFKTLVHEMGHAMFGWLFGYPSFPAFDVLWGGGVTLHIDRHPVLLAVIFTGILALLYVYRANRTTLALLVGLLGIYALLAFTSLHSLIIVFMGHGTELLIAGIFLYRALSGRAVVHAVERPLYAVIGFFLVFSDLGFAYRLIGSASFREEYTCAKGGCIDMDFVRIATEHLHVKLASVAGFFLVCCLIVPVVAFLAFRYEKYLHLAIAHLLTRRPDETVTEPQRAGSI
jgi:hypothetical protein